MEIRIKKSTLYTFGVIIILLMGVFFFLKSSNGLPTANVFGGNSKGDVQKVVIGMKNYNYYPNTITVKENQPVRIYLDSSVVGCYRSFTIRDFGIAKSLPTTSDYIEFTPTKKGTYTFACSMGMGTGTLIVE